jgi:EpsI family protein
MTLPGPARSLVLAVCLAAAAAVIASASHVERVPPRESFATFPMDFGPWHGQAVERFDQRVLTVLGVDEYVNRVYASSSSVVGLYVGYYQSQRQGDTMHSPLNCLPGAGWQPMIKEHIRIPVVAERAAGGAGGGATTIEVNRFLIQKGAERQVVIYWYQSHGRVVASEYWGKIYTVVDAIRMNRTDAAMVRIICPVIGADPQAEGRAQRAAVAFTQAVFPMLGRYLPD